VIVPKILGDITNKIVEGIGKGIDFGAVVHLAEILIGIYLINALFSYLQGWITAGVTQKVTFNLRKNISLKINHLPLRYFDQRSHGDILSRVTNDVDTVSQNFNQSLTQIVAAITTIVGILVMMFIISWQLTLVALIILPVSFFLVGFVVNKSQKYF